MRVFLVALAVALQVGSVMAAPKSDNPSDEQQPDKIVEYKVIDGVKLKLHVFNPANHQVTDKRPAIVFFFGGGWNGGTVKQFFPQSEYLASRGMVAICADYRVKSRHKTTPQECVKDGKSAIRWTRAHANELGIDPDRIVASGGSAGGHVAAAAALTDGFNETGEDTSISCLPNALVLYNAVFDNSETGYGYYRVKDYWQEISPLHNIDEEAPPTLVLLGTKDDLIPVATAEEYKKRMEAAGVRCDLRLYEGARHGFFNQSKPETKYQETLIETDRFLSSLGYLERQFPSMKVAKDLSDDRDARMAWWREAKFGMFVHWGVYSVVGGEYKGQKLPNSAEWMMNRGKIPIAEYKKYADQFNPTKFDADEFVNMAKNAGMKYIVITAKHHDGFSMFGSQATDYNVVDATPFKRDIMKELSEACQKQGIRLGFYYSQAQDWHHPGGMGNNWDKTLERVSNDQYVREKAYPEAKQLLTEYGPISIFWWDTPRKMSKEALDSLYSTRFLQPGLITNDRLGEGYPGDHKTFERKIPPVGPTAQDWEVCMPISGSWGYKRGDNNFKSVQTLIRNLADIASKGGNYLLNVSPTGEGTLLPQAVERLEAIGAWMKINNESIYGTTASPFGKLEWGRCTKKTAGDETILYLHVFDWPDSDELLVPGLKSTVQEAFLLADKNPLKTRLTEAGVLVSLPSNAPDENDSVIVLKVQGALDIDSDSSLEQQDGSLVLTAETAFLHNNEGSRDIQVQGAEGTPNIGYWTDAHAWVEWSVKFDQPGTYEVSAEMAIEKAKSSFRIGLPEKQVTVEVTSTGGYGSYTEKFLGTIKIEQAGTYSLQIIPEADSWQPINLRKLRLKLK
ncbi:Carboxylesterase NlhH [Adhaeretor mobilis]|uniref:alpha-L-fucosidase n=2 Tax=Adhaeretor mobilis TaxID=1930276 RepID=A0A517N185_9BACT|nr:Carboxylesterase NlhH [Adhaeretor mobilis]